MRRSNQAVINLIGPAVVCFVAVLVTTLLISIIDSVVPTEHLMLGYLLPIIFVAIYFGSTTAVLTSFASGLAAAYVLVPPKFSFYIDDPVHTAELGFTIVLAAIASKVVGALAGGGAAWPLVARAQQPALPVVGFIRSTSLADSAHLVTAFRQGLKEAGFVEGQNVAIEYRFADNRFDRLPALVADLLRQPVAVIVGNFNSILAAKAATTTVPIVFTSGSDPVRDGLVTSLNRPGGNVTGVNFFGGVLGTKRLELLRQLVPQAKTIAVLINLTPDNEEERRDVRAAAEKIGLQLILLNVNSEREVEAAFATFVQRGTGALYVGAGGFMNSHRERLVTLAARHALPASYAVREAVAAGGLMSYGASIPDAYRQAGIYAGRILRGEKPADLPVMRSVKFEFVLNLKTANALGLDIPPTLLALADEVIE